MKKRYITVATVCLLLGSMSLTSCIGSFRLTQSVLKWNNQVGSKFLNELVFFAFWVLPVYEVTSLADVLVLNSIEFWTGRNPLTASVKVVDTPHGKYEIACDGKSYTITNTLTSESTRLNFIEDEQTWAVEVNGENIPFMTFVDDTHVRVAGPQGEYELVELTEQGVMAYKESVMSLHPEMAGEGFALAY